MVFISHRTRLRITFTLAIWAASTLLSCPTHAEITEIASGLISGTASDLSGLTGDYASTDGTGTAPKNQAGSFGSGIAYTGVGNVFIAVNDRGLGNGTSIYDDRFQILSLTVDLATHTITPKIIATRFFTNTQGKQLTGTSAAFPATGNSFTDSLRFDPEGVRVSPQGTFYVSDEYGPSLVEFNAQGKSVRRFPLPEKFAVAHPNVDGDAESTSNTNGRLGNRGMEGLAITPNGKTLVGIMQSPLIQDGVLDAKGKRVGINDRIITVDVTTGKTHEYLYKFEDGKKNGVSEIVAVNDHQFLVDERDGKGGTETSSKKLYLIDIAHASDISGIASLPTSETPPGIVPVTKTLFLDLLDPKYGLAGPDFPEKIEGLAFGPDLADGRHQLFVASDNDLISSAPTRFFAFAIDPSDLPGYEAQQFTKAFAF